VEVTATHHTISKTIAQGGCEAREKRGLSRLLVAKARAGAG
jgi:hypothetical protein